jgi:uncharacterized protein (TIGR03118 family)
LNDVQLGAIAAGVKFKIDNLVADQTGVAPTTDPLLTNPWGLSQAPGGPLWVANNRSGTSTLYDRETFAKVPLTVQIPGPGGEGTGAPTGAVFTSATGTDFAIHSGDKSGHSLFLFATEEGAITGWNPTVNQTQSFVAVNRSAEGDVYKGLALVRTDERTRLYAADFAHNQVRMFDGGFRDVGAFTDPGLPEGYAPFNVQTLEGRVYVAFAKREPGGIDEVAGEGLGFVDVFDTTGHLIRRLVSNGPLNAPWGLTIAPESFGKKFAGALLVGNFGDGQINAFDLESGRFIGRLKGDDGPVAIDGLWALHRGPNGSVLFSAGPNGEQNGLIGAISVASKRTAFGSDERVSMGEMTSGRQ